MKKSFLIGVISIMFLLFLVTPSNAILIEFDPVSQTVPVGDTAKVALVISDLGIDVAPSLSVFDLDITFDPAMLAFNSAAYGDTDLGDQLDLLDLGTVIYYPPPSDPGVGIVNLFELSFDGADVLNLLQASSFTLATLTFDTLAVGTSFLDIAVNALGDATDFPAGPLPLDANLQSGSITISPVPEPATILLLASGMAGLGVFGRKKFRK